MNGKYIDAVGARKTGKVKEARFISHKLARW
jgi:hypothetical protein